jgi:hypothetical protein
MFKFQGKAKEKNVPVEFSFQKISNLSSIAEGNAIVISWQLDSRKGESTKVIIRNGEAVWSPPERFSLCADFVKNTKTDALDPKKLKIKIKEVIELREFL